MNGATVRIVVGSANKTVFIASEDLLCFYSKVLDRSFKSGFMEAKTKTLECPEDSAASWEDLLTWMCIGKVPVAKRVITRLDFMEDRMGLRPLLQLYSLGHKLLIEDVQEVAFAKMKHIIETDPEWSEHPAFSPKMLHMLLERTQLGSDRRRFLARWTGCVLMVRSESPQMYKELVHEHPDFFVDVMMEMQETLEGPISCHSGNSCETARKRWSRFKGFA